MSSDIACIPQWKVALMERRRKQDKDTAGRPEQFIDVNSLPSWKREILVKKQQQKNTLVFMARSPGPTSKDTDHGQMGISNGTEHCSNITNSTGFNKRCSCPPDITDVDICNSCSSVRHSVGHDEIDNRPIEERLLPINRNPILRLDIEKRHHSSCHSARNSFSPRSAESAGSHDRTSLLDETGSLTSPGVFLPPDTADCDVFNTEENNENEVTYGRGFVHKLLMKFSHLASCDQATLVNMPSRNSLGSVSMGRLSVVSPSSSKPSLSSVDAESLSVKSHSITPRAKCHSVDDLLVGHNHQLSTVEPQHQECADSRQNGDLGNGNLNGSGHVDSSLTSRSPLATEQYCISDECDNTEELSLANIVSSKRSLFENLVTSPQQSNVIPQSVLYNRFNYVDTLEKGKNKPATLTVNKCVDQSLSQNQSERNPAALTVNKCVDQSLSHENQSERNPSSVSTDSVDAKCNDDKVNGDCNTVSDIVSSPQNLLAANHHHIPGDLVKENGININATDKKSTGVKFPTVNGYRLGSKTTPTVSQVSNTGLKSDKVVENSATIPKMPSSNNNQENVVRDKGIPNNGTIPKMPSSSNNQENVVRDKGIPSSATQRNTASRPGMLLIRPASNLVAAKTKTEYLALTKYNDVRTGEFAPAVKKAVEELLDNDSINEVDGDPAMNEQFAFIGAGVRLNRSLLDKTKHGRLLQINFDDSLTHTFEYPSEQSLMDATPAKPGDCDYQEDTSLTKTLRNAPISGTSAALASYRSRMQVDYQIGSHVKQEQPPEVPKVSMPTKETVQSPDHDSSSPVWSKGASADLLF